MKIKSKFKFFILCFAIIFIFTLTSCSACSNNGYATLYDSDKANKISEANNSVEWVVEKLDAYKASILEEKPESTEDEVFAKIKEYAVTLISQYANYAAISGNKKEDDIEKHYKTQFIKYDVEQYQELIENASVADKEAMPDYSEAVKVDTGCTACFKAQTNTAAQKLIDDVNKSTNIYEIVATFTLKVKERTQEGEPLHFYADSFGDFMGHFFNNLFVFPVGWLLYFLSSIFGGYYIVGLLLTTLIIRTLGWPIYAKTNDMSIKMKAIEPEIQKLQEKYANRKDPDSQRMMQMEQARLYKQNGIGLGGCVLPFLQFPIFMAIFRAISRLPYTVSTGSMYTLNWGAEIKSTFLGLDLFKDYTAGTTQLIWIIVLVILVAGTQLLSQILSELRQKQAKEKTEEDIPAYRRQAVKQQANDQQRSMKMIMYMMIIMMAIFVWTSKAGLGIYWLIGNCYSMLQMYINSKQSEKKLLALKEKQKANRYGGSSTQTKSKNQKTKR